MICINLNDPTFKFLAEHHGVSINKLDLITHKYRIMTGIEDAFPSNVFIDNELGKTPYIETIQEVIDKYNKAPEKYAPKEFSTIEEANNEAKSLIKQGFPAQAIVIYLNDKNGYTLSVRRPVKKLENKRRLDFTSSQEWKDYNLINGTIPVQYDIAGVTPIPVKEMNSTQLWDYLSSFAEAVGERPISYTPIGKQRQEYVLKDGKIFNKEGKEVHYIGKDKNKILANVAIKEGRAVVVTHKDSNYVVDNLQQITSVKTGDIMKWGSENGDRKAIIEEAEKKFKTIIEERQQNLSDIVSQLSDLFKSEGIVIHDKTDMEKFLKENPQWSTKVQQATEENNIQMAIGGFVDKYSLPKGELPALSNALSAKFGNNTAYGDVITTANYEYTVIYRGVEDFDIIEYHPLDNNLNNKVNDKERRSTGSYDRLSARDELTEGECESNSYNVTESEANKHNAGLDKEALQGEPQQTQSDVGSKEYQGWSSIIRDSATGRVSFVKNGETNSAAKDWIEDVGFLKTSQGEIYGFADSKGELYFDETHISPNIQIHEYTHLWDRAVAQRNPKLWKRGVALMKQTSLWDEILNDANYGQKWKSIEGMTDNKLESLVASEVHARLVGPGAETLLARIAKEQKSDKIVNKLKQWILDFWKELKATFSDWSQEDIDNLTLDDFNKMTVRDLIDKVNLKEQQSTQQPIKQTQVPESSKTDNFITYEEVYTKDNADEVVSELLVEGYSREDIQVEHVPATETEDDYYLVKVKDNSIQTEENNVNPEHPTLSMKQQEEINQQLNDYDRINQQIEALQDNNILTNSEILHIAELAYNALSDMVTEIQSDKDKIKELFPNLQLNIDTQNESRRRIIDAIGVGRLLNKVRDLYFDISAGNEDDIQTMQKMVEIYTYWDGIVSFGVDVFEMNEGCGIRRTQGFYTTIDNQGVENDGINENDDPDSVREQVGDEQEYWMQEQRTVDIMSSVSALVRRAIHECYLLNKDGEYIKTYGIKERVHPREAITSLHAWTVGAQSLPEMLVKINEKTKSHPWLTQLYNKLADKSGRYSDLQSQFFTTMCMSHQLYSVGIKENGEYKVLAVNEHPAASEIMKTISGMFRAKAHPLFNGENNAISGKLLGSKDNVSDKDTFSLHKALETMRQIQKAHDLDMNQESFTEKETETLKDVISGVCAILGFDATEDVVEQILENKNAIIGYGKYEHVATSGNRRNLSMLQSLEHIVNNLDKAYANQIKGENKEYQPFTFGEENNIRDDVSKFLKPITDTMEESYTNVVFSEGKLYQGFVTPSFLTRLFEKFHWDGERFRNFMEDEYGKSEWFKLKGKYRTPWLEELYQNKEARDIFKHRVELSFNKRTYMKRMSVEERTISLVSNFFAEYDWDSKGSRQKAWYAAPIMSNKPSAEFIRFYAEMGMDFKKKITDGLFNVFLQELSRIQTVRMRNLSPDSKDYIKNWDKFGRQFCFLRCFNGYLEESSVMPDYLPSEDNAKFAAWLQDAVSGKGLGENEAEFNKLAQDVIFNATDRRATQILLDWEHKGLLKEMQTIEKILSPNERTLLKSKKGEHVIEQAVRNQVEKFLWNDHFATINILQITVGDIAAFKDADDLQKRLSALHAPGLRPNVDALDYGDPDKGIAPKRVSDGKYRTVILTDWDDFKSNIIENISIICDRRIEAAPDSQKAGLRAWKEVLVGKEGLYQTINVADAEAYSSPSSYRKKALMFGKWSHTAEDVYKKLLNGEFKATQLEAIFPVLKPFVYGKDLKDVGIKGEVESPIQTMPIPFIAKNSEYLLIMADAIIKGAEKDGIQTGKPCFLRAIFDIMEESERLNPGRGIDTIQFASAIKGGNQGNINLHEFVNNRFGEAFARNTLKRAIYKTDEKGELTSEYDTRSVVHEEDYGNYCIQQEVPNHFQEHYQAQGSQERVVVPSDLDMLDAFGNTNMYVWTDSDGTQRKTDAKTTRKELEETTADNINTSVADVRTELGLAVTDKNGRVIQEAKTKKEQNLILSKILQEEILSAASRYGIELFQACQIDKNTGDFKVPKGDPTISKRIEQLINSYIKRRVNKQLMEGGPIVQVSNFGTSEQLHIRFNVRSGGLLKLESEFTPTEKYKTYKEYAEAEQAGIAYFEVFGPAWTQDVYKYFTDANGFVDIDAIELIAPDLLRMISYRIPTEDKYSIAPMKIMGFLPKEAGDAIMFPYELTGIDDSDYDVDKRYTIVKHVDFAVRFEQKENENATEAEKNYIKHNSKSIIEHLINTLGLTTKYTSKELQKVIKEAEGIASMSKEAEKRLHEERLDIIAKRNAMVEDAEDNVTFSNNSDKDIEIFDKRAEKRERSYEKAVAKEEGRYQAKLAKIEEIKDKEIEKGRKNIAYERVLKFLKEDRFQPAAQDDKLTRALRKAYYDYMFKPMTYTFGKHANDNKIFEITWGILTNEMTAGKILNPGGFEEFKKLAYTAEAYRKSDLSWDELESKSVDELKDIINKDKDLTWVDTQLQYYKQNAAAASLVGVFAVNKAAHAIIEGNDIFAAVDDICESDEPFTIGKTPFAGSMEIDMKEDTEGNLIGKTLGSGVAASTDAAKEPCLDLLNIDMNTVNILTTMVRMGVPLETAAFFLAQDVISKVMSYYNRQKLNSYVSLDEVIEEYLESLKESIQEAREEMSSVDIQDTKDNSISIEELKEGIKEEHNEVIDYKVLKAFQKIKKLAEAMRHPTFATRFNSISSAVGPLILDNLITKYKALEFTDFGKGTGFYNSEGEVVDIYRMFAQMPTLGAFYRAYDVAEEIFKDFPAGSYDFWNLMQFTVDDEGHIHGGELAEQGILKTLMNDKKLFGKFLDFYTSAMLVEANLINPEQLKYFIEEFPTEFLEKKKDYKDNAFIQAIIPVENRRTGRTFLQIPLTNMDNTEKSRLRAGWIDFHKEEPEMSIKLATYWFFRDGIGFSPKTGTAVIPDYVKSRWIASNDISYNDVYRQMQSITPNTLVNLFIRNNWNDNKLVPIVKDSDKNSLHYTFSKNNTQGKLEITGNKVKKLKEVKWIKTSLNNGDTYLWHQTKSKDDYLAYEKVNPLGDNNDYVVITNQIVKDDPIHNATKTKASRDYSEFTENKLSDVPNEGTSIQTPNVERTNKKVSEMALKLFEYQQRQGYKFFTQERAQNAINQYLVGDKNATNAWSETMKRALKLDLNTDEETLRKEVEKYCD